MSPRKHLPPIAILGAPQSTSSGNAFAIAKAREDDALEKHRNHSNAFYALEKKSAMSTPTGTSSPTTTDNEQPSRSLEPNVNTIEELECTPTTTMTRFIDAGQESPPGTSVAKVPTSIDRSLEGKKLVQSQVTRQSVESKGNEDTQATARAMIEARYEKKLFKIMGIAPTTPTSSDSERDAIGSTTVMISQVDLSDACAKAAVKVEQNERKSPKKKLFGMSIPNFRTTTTFSTDDPPMPPKAAQVLGSSSSKKHRHPRHIKGQRSDTSTSLPPKLGNTDRSHDKPIRLSHQSKSYYGSLTESSWQLSSNPIRRPYNHSTANKRGLPSSLEYSEAQGFPNKALPPTPETKKTPPNTKVKHAQTPIDGLGISTTYESKEEHKRAPSDTRNLRLSPTKFCPYGAQEYTSLIKNVPSINSMHGIVENDGNYSAPLEGVRRGRVDGPSIGSWSEGQAKERGQQIGMLHDGHLPPTFYTPSDYSIPFSSPGYRPSHNFDTQRFLISSAPNHTLDPTHAHTSQISGESIEVCFQDNAHEILSEAECKSLPTYTNNLNCSSNHNYSSAQSPGESSLASIICTGLRMPFDETSYHTVNQETSGFNCNSKLAGESLTGQREISTGKESNSTSFGLTPLSNEQHGRSSPKGRFKFVPHHPSALPTPLYGHTTMPRSPLSHLLADGSDIITHFGVANHHIDLVAESLHRSIDMTKQETVNSIIKEYNETVSVLETHVSDIKAHLNAVEHNMGRMSGETETANSKLDKLVEFLREEIVEPLIKNIESNVTMGNELKALQSMVQELQKKLEATQSQFQHPLESASSSNDASLPAHRFQSPRDLGLSTFDESSLGLIRELPVRIHAVREMRNNGRFQQYCHDVGQTWVSTEMGREQQESIRRQYLASYAGNGPGEFGGGNGGAYAGAYSTGHSG